MPAGGDANGNVYMPYVAKRRENAAHKSLVRRFADVCAEQPRIAVSCTLFNGTSGVMIGGHCIFVIVGEHFTIFMCT